MMSADQEQVPGTVLWHDLTVTDAEPVRGFYQAVMGWQSQPVAMGAYEDFSMVVPATGETVAGICHALGENADLPPQWLIYFRVPDVAAAAARCKVHGGEVIAGPRALAGGTFCVIRDPAGAVCALYQP
jgi:predicted enzyme related to lactoylglutathione lyase